MRRRNTILFGAAIVLLVLTAVGCSIPSAHSSDHTHEYDPSYEAEREASLKYLIENFPTLEQTLSVRECITAKTGFDEFFELPADPADYGPPSLTPEPRAPMPEIPDEVNAASEDCIFELGLEDRYYPPWDHEAIRNADDRP